MEKNKLSDQQTRFMYVVSYYLLLFSMATVLAPQIFSVLIMRDLFGTFGSVICIIAWNYVAFLVCRYLDTYEEMFPERKLRLIK